MGLLEILKAQGASDADIEAMKPLLANEKFTSAIESELSAKSEAEKRASEFEKASKDFEAKFAESSKYAQDMQEWYNSQAMPAMTALQKDAMKAREEAVRLQERLRAAKDYGLADIADPIDPIVIPEVKPEPVVKQDLPDLSKYATNDFLLQVAEKEGEAIAMAADISQEHRDLFGTRLNMTELRKKAVEQKKTLSEVWQSDYRVADRRAELAREAQAAEEKKKQDWIESIRREEREKVLSQIGNPQTRDPLPSKFPGFANKDTSTPAPWEKRDGLRANERVSKVLTTLAKSGVA
jgi:hypothetical protein